jgi:hypothetical protein
MMNKKQSRGNKQARRPFNGDNSLAEQSYGPACSAVTREFLSDNASGEMAIAEILRSDAWSNSPFLSFFLSFYKKISQSHINIYSA